ncbi:YdcF family protein [Dethiosulfovibrio salsuginis]|uniref:YdcF family protein n=1 Tax=Dethiosulfovibrio salsuginis TaxID=561720 RepID=UPI000A1CF0CD|nr:YdcF family protein [Dethiosulfovibrio salsuginis]
MFFVYKLAGALGMPLGLFLSIILAGIICISLSRKKGPLFWTAAGAIAIGALSLITLSMPAVAGYLLSTVETDKKDLPESNTSGAVLILSGGFTRLSDGTSEPGPFTLQRLIEGASLAERRGWPIILSGGMALEGGDSLAKCMERKLRELGYTAPVILEEDSRTTWENMFYSSTIAREKDLGFIVVVTNSFHMRRSLWMAKRAIPEMDIYGYPVGPLGDRSRDPLRWIPSAGGLRDSTLAWREWLGLMVYRFMSPSGSLP